MTADTGGATLHPMFTPELLEIVRECGVARRELVKCHQELTAAADAAASGGADEWLEKRQLFREASARCEDVGEKLGQFIDDFSRQNDGSVVGHGGSLR